MQQNYSVSPIKKTLPAWAAAITMALFIGLAIIALGLNALFNQNVSVVRAANQPDPQMTADQTNIENMQATLSQYQQREVQYQNELKQAADQINQISQQNQQYQQLFQALQQAGIIQVTQDGRVFVPRGSGFSSGEGGDHE